jgi:hypothetical protein
MNSFKNKITKIIVLIIILVTVCGIFSGCEDKTLPETPDETVIPIDSTEEPDTIEPSVTAQWDCIVPLVPLVEPEKMDIIFPDPLPDYMPEVNVFPLLNDINGKVNFIDKNYNLIDIPEEAVGYYPCYSYETKDGETISTLQAYCLVDKNSNYAVMNLSDELVTDFIYRMIPGEWRVAYSAYKGYLIVCERADIIYESGNGYTKALCGVLDIRTGKEVVPLIYPTAGSVDIWMNLYDGYILTSSGGIYDEIKEYKLLDYSGNLIYDFGKENPNAIYEDGGGWGLGAYGLNVSEHAIYKKNIGLYIDYYDNYYVMQDYSDGYSNKKISVYDKNKNHIFSKQADSIQHFINGENIIINDKAERIVYVITTDNNIKIFKCDFEYAGYFEYENDTLIFGFNNSQSENLGHIFSIDTDGNVLSKTPLKTTYPGPEYFDYKYGELVVRYDIVKYGDKRFSLLDRDGNVLIPCGKYDNFMVYDSFVIAQTGEGRPHWESEDIYDNTGNLLLADVAGYTVEIPGDGLIVYKSKTVFGILSPDGSFKEIDINK